MADQIFLGDEAKELKIGPSFEPDSTCAFHSIRYDFKPASVDPAKQAQVSIGAGHSVNVKVPHVEGSGTTATVFKGNKKPTQKECVLIINHDTGEISLEKLSNTIQLKKTRVVCCYEGSGLVDSDVEREVKKSLKAVGHQTDRIDSEADNPEKPLWRQGAADPKLNESKKCAYCDRIGYFHSSFVECCQSCRVPSHKHQEVTMKNNTSKTQENKTSIRKCKSKITKTSHQKTKHADNQVSSRISVQKNGHHLLDSSSLESSIRSCKITKSETEKSDDVRDSRCSNPRTQVDIASTNDVPGGNDTRGNRALTPPSKHFMSYETKTHLCDNFGEIERGFIGDDELPDLRRSFEPIPNYTQPTTLISEKLIKRKPKERKKLFKKQENSKKLVKHAETLEIKEFLTKHQLCDDRPDIKKCFGSGQTLASFKENYPDLYEMTDQLSNIDEEEMNSLTSYLLQNFSEFFKCSNYKSAVYRLEDTCHFVLKHYLKQMKENK